MRRSRLIIADEDVLFRTALAVVLVDEGYEVAGQAGTSREAVRHLSSPVDLVLVSGSLPGGISALLQQRSGVRRLRTLVLSPVCDHEQLVSALDAGAQGYLGKDVGLPDLLAAIAAVLRGEAVVPPMMLGGLLHELVQRRRPPAPDGLKPLSRREQEVLELLAQGHAQEGIAKALVISPQTARTHIQKVIGKLGAHSRVEAVAVALRHGLVAAS